MQHSLAALLVVLVSLSPLSASPPSKAKPKEVSVIGVFPEGNFQKKPFRFTQGVRVELKDVPSKTDPLTSNEWRFFTSNANGTSTILQRSADQSWTTTVIGNDGQAQPVQQLAPAPARNGSSQPLIQKTTNPNAFYLVLPSDTLAPETTSVQASFHGSQFSWIPSLTPASTSLFEAVSTQSEADNFLTGSYSPAIHSQPQYTINGQGTLTKEFGESNFYWGAIGTVATDNRPSANPDSFFVSGVLKWVPIANRFWGGAAQGVLVDWDFAGLEFDRQTTNKTFISSPIVEIPVRIYPAPGKDIGSFLAVIYPYFGIETGTNLSNALNPDGSGFVFRGLFGASVTLSSKTPLNWLQQVSLTVTDSVRIPATNEIFTNLHFISATEKTATLPVLSTQVRNHVSTQLALTVAKPFSITVKYENGELPPAFRTVKNKVTIGLTVTLKQSNGGLSKIDPEKN
jgi:hypothetical protein